MKGKVILKPNSHSVEAVKIPNTNILYGVDSKFQLPEGIIPLYVLHRVDHKTTRELNMHISNTSSNSVPISKSTVIGTLTPAIKVENVCNINWSTPDKIGAEAVKQVEDLSETKGLVNQLLPEILSATNQQLGADTKGTHEAVTPDADIPEEARAKLRVVGNEVY